MKVNPVSLASFVNVNSYHRPSKQQTPKQKSETASFEEALKRERKKREKSK